MVAPLLWFVAENNHFRVGIFLYVTSIGLDNMNSAERVLQLAPCVDGAINSIIFVGQVIFWKMIFATFKVECTVSFVPKVCKESVF